MNNEEYIQQHREDDVRKLALKRAPEGVDMTWCLQQIEGWQLARKKLPRWAATEGVWFPPRLSMEQCSSELTAQYKRSIVERLLPTQEERTAIMDMTGGFGIDFSYMAQGFREAIYVERLPHLCDIARHNFALLRIENGKLKIENLELTTEQFSIFNSQFSTQEVFNSQFSIYYLDPARRDDIGRKVAALEDCSPNVIEMKDWLLDHANYVILKLSPMLDIKQAMRQLEFVKEVHVVSVKGECKELILVLTKEASITPSYHCVNLETEDDEFTLNDNSSHPAPLIYSPPQESWGVGGFLYEPNASILKAGIQDALCQRYGVEKLHPMSNLFVGKTAIEGFPGRCFEVTDTCDFSKKELKRMLGELKQANLAIRNFPSTVAELRKRLKLKEGGDVYLFATTLADGTHCLIRCKKSSPNLQR